MLFAIIQSDECLCSSKKAKAMIMSENLRQIEGLKILARIIAKVYLAKCQEDREAAKPLKRLRTNEVISRTRRNSQDGKRSYQP
jgi:hypothetical protein